ncbi:hypothetical protein FH972_025038 [Carpinus fangiana]|uniref:Protein kinase domain-containing protein n=1 Tax=Carpinus fangiana TaxID=176857 RepID=A0A5N6KZV6_9ROSI|nr:hypothetical protein FH972_025038 [Carpinus fangiana]
MFSSALNKLTSNISSNYSIAPQPSSVAGPWKIFDGKHRASKKQVSIFIFDRKTLDPGAGSGGLAQSRSGGTSLKRAHDEVVERLRKEASSLARLRHPSILELAEPVEDTRSGGLMFATEPVTTSLAGLLAEKDDQANQSGPGDRRSRYVVEDTNGGAGRRREIEMDELEIQKGLLQVGKGLEFLHESAGLVHANLTPDAIFINAKSDWKISGLGFATPPDQSTKATSITPISLSEVLNYDPRLPRIVQLNLDYTSPDFVLDTNIIPAADMFSLGLIIIAMYSSPHKSPINTGQSLSTYRRTFSSPSTVPTVNNNFQISQTFPNDIKILEKKVLPALLEESKDAELLSLILSNVFKAITMLPDGKRTFSERVVPALRSVFLTQTKGKAVQERDSAKEGGLMIVIENMSVVTANCSGKEFKDDILPIVYHAFDSPTPSLVDAALSTLSMILPVLDFSTIKNELFPAVAHVFSKTSSMAIKIRGLKSLCALCGGSPDSSSNDEDDFMLEPTKKATNSSAILDKYTIQEKVVPLLRAIKTKEPAVMMAALNVFEQVGKNNVWASSGNAGSSLGNSLSAAMQPTRAITPDHPMSSFATLTPNQRSLFVSAPTQSPNPAPASWMVQHQNAPSQQQQSAQVINWGSAAASNPWTSPTSLSSQQPSLSFGATSQPPQQPSLASLSINNQQHSSVAGSFGSMTRPLQPQGGSSGGSGFGGSQNSQKQGMDKYESLI